MQMLGIGIPELVMILVLAVLVIGPDRLPAFAADLARWIRQMRAYASHLTKDFNEVVSDLEKEAGATREDWKEIASVVSRQTRDVEREVQQAAAQADDDDGATRLRNAFRRADGAKVANDPDSETNMPPPIETAAAEAQEEPEAPEATAEPAEEKPWYVPEPTTRRRASD